MELVVIFCGSPTPTPTIVGTSPIRRAAGGENRAENGL